MDSFYKALFPSGKVDKTQLSLEKIMQTIRTEEETAKNALNIDYSPLSKASEGASERPSGGTSEGASDNIPEGHGNGKSSPQRPVQLSRKEKREAERSREKMKQKEAKEAQKRQAKKRELAQNLARLKQETATEIRTQSFAPEVRERLEKIAFNLK